MAKFLRAEGRIPGGALAGAAAVVVTLLGGPRALAAPVAGVVVRGTVAAAEDGRPLAGVTVDARGSRVAPVVTGADGRYQLVVPPGASTLVATPDPCHVAATRPVGARSGPVIADLRLATRTDRSGYGCTATPMRWIDARDPVVIPDAGPAVVPLPFPFPYHGQTFTEANVTWFGFATLGPMTSFGWPTALGSSGITYGIVPLWAPFNLDDASSITSRSTDDRLVISWNDLPLQQSDRRLTFQLQLARDGTIDVLYRDVAGIAPLPVTAGLTGAEGDVFTFAQNQPLPSNTAWRYRMVATTSVRGVVRNANDRGPVAGATVTALPGGRSVTTDPDGRYTLAVIPGWYRVSATAPWHGSTSAPADAGQGPVNLRRMLLPAPSAVVSPQRIEVDPAWGSGVHLTNNGALPLHWAVFERDDGAAPVAGATDVIEPGRPVDGRRVAVTSLLPTGGPARRYVADLAGGSDGWSLRLRVTYTPEILAPTQISIEIWLDTDQSRATGRTMFPSGYRGTVPVDVGLGVEYVLVMQRTASATVDVIATATGATVATLPASWDGRAFGVDVPLGLLGPGEPGDIDVATGVSTPHSGLVEWTPTGGRASIRPALEAPWLAVSPTGGTVAPGDSVLLDAQLVADSEPGDHGADLRIETDDPRRPTIHVPAHAVAPPPA
jgi:hypothetical protein